jgi:hypothetical protein
MQTKMVTAMAGMPATAPPISARWPIPSPTDSVRLHVELWGDIEELRARPATQAPLKRARKMKMTLQIHPVAALFPMLDNDEIKALAADIKAQGLNNSIVTDYSGNVLLDGRNRLKACEMVGIEPHLIKLAHDKDPVEFILARNVNRRHMTQGQNAVIVAKVVVDDYKAANCFDSKLFSWEEFRKGGRGGNIDMRRRARATGISASLLSHALDILQYAPEWVDRVVSGFAFDAAYLTACERKKRLAQPQSPPAKPTAARPPKPPPDAPSAKPPPDAPPRPAAQDEAETITADIDLASLSARQRLEVEAAICQEKRRLEAEFNQRVQAELHKRRIEDEKAREEIRRAYYREMDERRERRERREGKAHGGVMAPPEYKLILSCLHPDPKEDPTVKQRYEDAFKIFNQDKVRDALITEKRSLKSLFDDIFAGMEKTPEERAAAREKYEAEKRARQRARS